ncbi:FeoB-associated Cys-rich membrane protein [Prevotella pallens]|uniref:FeoB-associated Cys-rich membrane protein n=1 Tax=Prevotella pallens TaxID=60133 RepID=UPI001CABC79A|nr:FeoB-associated Cys-rich membrane protein [Prevotella pallens]MBF1462163.1 FeoB-associated Cys-rich membrane protein [Prevotella pallens]
MIQYTIVTIVIAIAIAYAIRMLIRTIKVSKNACGGCPGCAIKGQMMRKKTTYKYERR